MKSIARRFFLKIAAATGLVVLLVAWLAGRLARRPEAQPSA